MPLNLYNTFSNKDEEFSPIEEGKVRMYTCGPTVYGRPHIGNYSSFLMADLLRRWLEVSGYEVTHVKNITDVGHLVADADEGEDKVEKQAQKEKVNPLDIAQKYTEQYLEDEKALNMLEPHHRPKATETIQEMISIIEKLVASEHAYETQDGVYFSVESFPEYGKLSGNLLENLSAGARVKVKEEKKHPADFALWKKCVGVNADHILRWDSPWGAGFPGWHIECSAMSQKFLGEQIDIHTGGEDNIFPHHECEIAQSECSGPKPFVRYWVHRRRIDMGTEKMSKSLGNVLNISDIEEMGYSPLDLRYYFLSVHYRTQLKFTEKGLSDSHKARRKIMEWMSIIDNTVPVSSATSNHMMNEQIDTFKKAMNEDLNAPAALADVFAVMHFYYQNPEVDQTCLAAYKKFIELVRQTFGCFDPEQVQEAPAEVVALVAKREEARQNKDFEASDSLRDEIAALGYEVRDLPEGPKVTKI
jgi:cysteinyl-tRNA synthetase